MTRKPEVTRAELDRLTLVALDRLKEIEDALAAGDVQKARTLAIAKRAGGAPLSSAIEQSFEGRNANRGGLITSTSGTSAPEILAREGIDPYGTTDITDKLSGGPVAKGLTDAHMPIGIGGESLAKRAAKRRTYNENVEREREQIEKARGNLKHNERGSKIRRDVTRDFS